MRKGKKLFVSLTLLTVTLLSSVTLLSAATKNVSGGTWNYGSIPGKGSDPGTVYSNYYHGSKTHRSSVQGATYVNSGWISKGKWSYASAKRRMFVSDQSYYDVK